MTRGVQRVKNELRRVKRRLTGRRHPAGLILMYHRIRSERFDPWEMCVTEAHFAQHLRVLRQGYHVHPLSRIKEVLEQDRPNRKNVFITFDDGYLDNYEAAMPQLTRSGFSATFFIPSRILNDSPVFWWEVIDQLFWEETLLPEEIDLGLGTHRFHQTLSPDVRRPNREQESRWSANTTLPPTERCQLYLNLSSWIKEKKPGEQHAIALQLLACLRGGMRPGISEKMSAGQIRHLAANGFEIGAHTVNHPALGYHDPLLQETEIREAKIALDQLTGKTVTTFAYPHGHFNGATRPILREAGLSVACTVDNGLAGPHTDLLALPRLFVKDLDAAGFRRQLKDAFNQ